MHCVCTHIWEGHICAEKKQHDSLMQMCACKIMGFKQMHIVLYENALKGAV